MKPTYLTLLAAAILFSAGCATQRGMEGERQSAETQATEDQMASEEATPRRQDTGDPNERLMERYKSGEIPGYRD